tara:strand:- start:301 stop:594 length:294 start_codon:yes stop_codon:yes gene_type:complete
MIKLKKNIYPHIYGGDAALTMVNFAMAKTGSARIFFSAEEICDNYITKKLCHSCATTATVPEKYAKPNRCHQGVLSTPTSIRMYSASIVTPNSHHPI